MADTKISALTGIAGGALAAGDEFPVADASDLTVSYSCTAANIKTFVNNAPVFAAGSASATTWPLFTSGTLLTTAEDGAIELDGECFYGCTDAGNRGVVVIEHFTRLAAAYTLISQTAEQAIFAAAAQDTLTLELGTYFFEMLVVITSMSATSGNLTLDILGAGTAVMADVLYTTNAVDQTTLSTAQTDQTSFQTAAQAANVIATAGTGTSCGWLAIGAFEVTTAGTVIPSIALVTATGASVAAGSFFRCHRIGATGVTAVGQWT